MSDERTSDGFPVEPDRHYCTTERRVPTVNATGHEEQNCVRCGGEGVIHEGGVHELCPACQGTRIPPRRLVAEIAPQAAALAAMTTERDEARAEVERLKKLVTMHEATTLLLETGRDSSQRRIAALEAVITRQAEMIVAQEQHSIASLRLAAAYADAGLPFGPQATKDVPVLAESEASR